MKTELLGFGKVKNKSKEFGKKIMPQCKYYGGITREELEHLKKDLEGEGIKVPDGDEVEFEGVFGVRLSATYDEAKETLKICITKKPFYIPESEVWKIVDAGCAPYVG